MYAVRRHSANANRGFPSSLSRGSVHIGTARGQGHLDPLVQCPSPYLFSVGPRSEFSVSWFNFERVGRLLHTTYRYADVIEHEF
jgi:hypothetical protein